MVCTKTNARFTAARAFTVIVNLSKYIHPKQAVGDALLNGFRCISMLEYTYQLVEYCLDNPPANVQLEVPVHATQLQ